MGRLVLSLFRLVRAKLFQFAVFVLILFVGALAHREWDTLQPLVRELPELRDAEQAVIRRQAVLADETTARLAQVSQAPVQRLDQEIRRLDADIARLQHEQNTRSSLLDILQGESSVAARMQQLAVGAAELEMRRQARAHLVVLRAGAVALADVRAAQQKGEALRQQHEKAYRAYLAADRDLVQARARAGWLGDVPYTPWYTQLRTLESRKRDLLRANSEAAAAARAQGKIVSMIARPGVPAAFVPDWDQLRQTSAEITQLRIKREALLAGHPMRRGYDALEPWFLPAAGIMGAALGLPVLVRLAFYYLLAPLAARRPAIVIQENGHPDPAPLRLLRASGQASVLVSAVSKRVSLAPGDEMLIRPDYCQSQPAGIGARTQLVFDQRRWLTSIAANLSMMTRLRPLAAAEVLVSSTVDPLDEVALVELAAAEAVVLQPRAIVGMVYRAGQRPAIRSHWRIGTLHAWLTLQLRYLAFEGPATLIVKGCRGVRLEGADQDRTVSQDMTIGFSAHARYATVRAEPFLAYLRGTQPLLHDRFSGRDAYFLCEEVPRRCERGVRSRHPLEGMVDAGLKAFGI